MEARKTPRFWVAVQPSIIRLYKVAGLIALTAILVGLIGFLVVNIFYFFDNSWVRPVVLSPTHQRVVEASTLVNDARLFYATIAITTLLGASLDFVGIDPAKALYWAAVVNGILAGPLMVVMMLIVSNPRAMGRLTISRRQMLLGWTATVVMIAASALFLGFVVHDSL